MPTIRVALCDDESSWLAEEERVLRAYSQETGQRLEILSFTGGEALMAKEGFVPDVLFADVELGQDANGIDLVRDVSAKWSSCQVVYVTNFLRYAPELYVTEHLWFALKERFEDRVPTIMEKLVQQMEDGSKMLTVETVDHDLLTVPCPQVVSLERRSRVTTITCTDGSEYLVPDRLANMFERLPERTFARCHGSFVVGLAHVRLVRRDSILLADGTEVPLSRRFARSFRERYLDWVDSHAL